MAPEREAEAPLVLRPSISGLPPSTYMRTFQVIAETKGSDTFQTIRRLTHACSRAFRIFQANRALVLAQVFESLIAQSPDVWELERVQRIALLVASVPPRSANGPVLTYQELAGYIRRFQELSEESPEDEEPTRRAFNPPSDIDTLARLVCVISPITPFLIKVDNNLTYNWPQLVFFQYTWVSQEEKMLKSYLLESELLRLLSGRGREGYRVPMLARDFYSWPKVEQDGAIEYEDFVVDAGYKSGQTSHPIGYGRVKKVRLDGCNTASLRRLAHRR